MQYMNINQSHMFRLEERPVFTALTVESIVGMFVNIILGLGFCECF